MGPVKIYTIRTLMHGYGNLRVCQTKHYQSWEMLEKWWPKRLADAQKLTNYYMGVHSTKNQMFVGCEVSSDEEVLASYKPWINVNQPLTKPKPHPVLKPLQDIERVAKRIGRLNHNINCSESLQEELRKAIKDIQDALSL